MQRFRFRLETVLQLRKRKEDEVKLALARKNNEIIRAQLQLRQMHDELNGLQQQQKESRQQGLNIVELRHWVAYRNKMKLDIIAKSKELGGLKKNLEEIRAALVQATKKKRAVELVREKRFAQWRKDYNNSTQKVTDDLSQQRFIRNRPVVHE
jgi:flagellar FliJ protein